MNKRRVLLFHPRTFHERNYSTYWVPYSLLSIASQVDRSKYDVTILDNNILGLEEFSTLAPLFAEASIVGITTMLGAQVKDALAFAQEGRVRGGDNLPIVVGGPGAILAPDLLLTSGYFDYVVSGQGELSFPQLLAALFENTHSLHAVPNLTFYNNGVVTKTTNKLPVSRDAVRGFDFDLIDVSHYITYDAKIGSRVINYVSSQGCKWKCGFCSDTKLYGNLWVGESDAAVVDNLAKLQARYNIDGVKFYDSNFDVTGERVISFCDQIRQRGLTLNWAASIHPYTLSRMTADHLSMLHDSNCRRLLVGAESGDDRVLQLVRKGLKVHTTRELARRLADADLCASYTFVVGFPTASEEHYDLTFSLAEELLALSSRNEIKIHFFLPFPGTPLADLSVAHGWRFPTTIKEWANIDYYTIHAPWVPEHYYDVVRSLNIKGCPSVT